MTQSTEQEQQLHQLLELVLTELDRKAIPVAYMQEIDRNGKAFIEKAARRAPEVLVPQGWKLVPVEPTSEMCFKGAIKIRWSAPEYLARHCYEAMLAAAPQPPEAAQLDDTNVADMAQAVDSKEAAPVQLPEPDAWRYTDARGHFRYRGARPGFAVEYPLLKPEALYTEQQVRQLLAAHGIQERST